MQEEILKIAKKLESRARQICEGTGKGEVRVKIVIDDHKIKYIEVAGEGWIPKVKEFTGISSSSY